MSNEDVIQKEWDDTNEWEREEIAIKTDSINSIYYCPRDSGIQVIFRANDLESLEYFYPSKQIAFNIYSELLDCTNMDGSHKAYTIIRIK